MSFQNLGNEVHNYQTTDIPMSLKSNNSAQAIPSKQRMVNLSALSSSQSGGGSVLFQIPPSSYAISRNSAFLKARITLTDGSANTVFSGPTWSNSAYRVINRLTLYAGSSNSIIQQRNYYADEATMKLMHNSVRSWNYNDAQILIANNAKPSKVGNSYYFDVCLPLPMFNTEQDFPLYLCSSSLILQIDLNNANAAFYSPGVAVSDFTLSNCQLVYESIELDHQFIDAERQAIKSSPFVYPMQSQLSFKLQDSQLNGYNLGLSCSSLRGVFVMMSNKSSDSQNSLLLYQRQTTDGSGGYYNAAGTNFVPNSMNGAGVQFSVFLDGRLVTPSIFDTPAIHYAGLKQALRNELVNEVYQSMLGNEYYTTATGTAPAANANVLRSSLDSYCSDSYVLGTDTTSFNDEGTIMGGSPVSQISFQFQGLNTFGNACTIIAIFDTLLAFTADGMEVKR